VVICDKEQLEAKQINGPLHNIFMKHGVVRSEGLQTLTSMRKSPIFMVLNTGSHQ
jgi:hypothetical protein